MSHRTLRNYVLTEDELAAAIRGALEVSNAEALNETTAAFQRRGINFAAREISNAYAARNPDFDRAGFMDECGFVAWL